MSFPLKLTVFTNVYNEEYMLPFWLEHHKGIFDHGVVFDWDSTDSSMDIVRKVCPTWEIIKAPQKYFDAYENDVILMNEEMKHTGYKMVLNTTEFLISPNPIRQYLSPNLNSYYMRTVPSVLSTISYQDPRNLLELFSGIERVCIGGIPITDRAKRCIHSYNHGHYSLGRHRETLPITEDIPFYTIWFGFYPWNPKFHQRKLQIKDRIPMSDIQKGSSRQHMETQEGNEYRRKKALELSTPIDEVPFLRECLNYSMLMSCAKSKNRIQFVFGNCFPFSPFSASENRNTIPEAELLSINLAERLANENNNDVKIFADKDSIGHMNDGVFVNKVCYINIDSLFSLQELEVVILHGYSGIHTWAHLRRLNLPKKILCVYISGDLSSFDAAFPTSFKNLQSDNALFCLNTKNQLQMKFCKQLSENEICFIDELTHVIESPHYNIDHVCKVTNYHNGTDAVFKVFDDCIISEELRHNRKWEPHLHSIFDKYITSNSTVVEVGCHIGSHSVKLSKLCKFLYCFEPMPKSNALLLKNLNLNSCNNVNVFTEGLSKTKSKTFFQYSMIGNIGASSLADNPTPPEGENPFLKHSIQSSKDIEVHLITLDSLCLEALDFMKIDVEGYEPYVLEGAMESIKKFMPIIVLESYSSFLGTIDFEFTKNKFQNLIQLGYNMQHIEGPDYLFIKDNDDGKK